MAFPAVASSATNNVQGSNVGPAKPSGLAVGDLIVLVLSAQANVNQNANVNAPDGTWTQIAKNVSASNIDAQGMWYKVATSTELALTSIGTLVGDRQTSLALRITGADTVTPVILNNSAIVTGASLTTPGITPVLQSLLLNLVAGGNNASSTSTASAQAVANSNPSWTITAAVAAPVASNLTSNVTAAWANETGAPNSATGNATATLTGNSKAIIAIVSIQAPVFVADFFTATFSTFAPTLPVIISALVSAVFSVFAPTTADVPPKWSNEAKNAAATFVNETKN